MKLSRKAFLLLITVAMLGTACGRFAPKADVAVKAVGVDLAFGVKVEDFKPTEPPVGPTLSTGPTSIPTPTPTGSIFEPPPPSPDVCPPTRVNSARDGPPPPTMGDHEFAPDTASGGRPRSGNYYTFYQGNVAGQELKSQFTYREVSTVSGDAIYRYELRDFFYGIYYKFVVVTADADQEDEGAGTNRAGIYLRGIDIPLKDEPSKRQIFNTASNGVRLLRFPIAEGTRLEDQQPVPPQASTGDDTIPQVPGGGTVLRSVTTVVSQDPTFVLVCDQLAQAWKVHMQLDLNGPDVDARLVGTFWFATQYGGWPIQESFSLDGGPTLTSGNFFTRLARLDPGDVV